MASASPTPAHAVRVVISPKQAMMTALPSRSPGASRDRRLFKTRVVGSPISNAWAHGSAFAFEAAAKAAEVSSRGIEVGDKNRDCTPMGVSCGRGRGSTSTAASSLSLSSDSLDVMSDGGAGAVAQPQSVCVTQMTLKLGSSDSVNDSSEPLRTLPDVDVAAGLSHCDDAKSNVILSRDFDASPRGKVDNTLFSPDVDLPLILEKCDIIAGESGSATPVSESHFIFESPVVEEEVEVSPPPKCISPVAVDDDDSAGVESADEKTEVLPADNASGGPNYNNTRTNIITVRSDHPATPSHTTRVRTKVVTVKKTVVKRVLVKRKVSKPRCDEIREETAEEEEATESDMRGKPGSVTQGIAINSVKRPGSATNLIAKTGIGMEKPREGVRSSVKILKAESALRRPVAVSSVKKSAAAEPVTSPVRKSAHEATKEARCSVKMPVAERVKSSVKKPESLSSSVKTPVAELKKSSIKKQALETAKETGTKGGGSVKTSVQGRTKNSAAKPVKEASSDSRASLVETPAAESVKFSVKKPAWEEEEAAKDVSSGSFSDRREGSESSVKMLITEPKKMDDSVKTPFADPTKAERSHSRTRVRSANKDRKSKHQVSPLGSSPQQKASSKTTNLDTKSSSPTRKAASLGSATPSRDAQRKLMTLQPTRPSRTASTQKRNSVPTIPTYMPANGTAGFERRKSAAAIERKKKKSTEMRRRSLRRNSNSGVEKPPWNASTKTARPANGRKKGVVGLPADDGSGNSRRDVFSIGTNERKWATDAYAVIAENEIEEETATEKCERRQLPETDLLTLRKSTTLSDSDLQHMKESALQPKSSPFGDAKRRVMPRVRRKPSVNPIRQLISRKDVSSEVSVTTSNRRWSSLGFSSSPFNPDGSKSDFHEAALAGLASREDFKSVILRKTKKAADGTAIDEEKEDPSNYPPLVVVQIKGRRRIQVTLVEPSYRSLNSNDVFLVLTPTELYHFVGSDANVIEKAKGVDLASRIIQKKDMGCKARAPSLIEEKTGTTGLRMVGLKKAFGGTGNGEIKIKSGSDVASDDVFEKTSIQSVMIYSVKENAEQLDPLADICGKPPKHSLLETKSAFVFDFVNEVYVWIGRMTLGSLRRKAMKLGRDLFDSGYRGLQKSNGFIKNGISTTGVRPRPDWALFSRMTEDRETFLFKEKFPDWPEPGRIIKMKGHVSSGEVQPAFPSIELVPCNGEAMHKASPSLPDCVLEGANLGRGRGIPPTEDKPGISVATTAVTIWHVKENDFSEIPEWERGVFYSAEGYIVRWGYRVFKELPKRKAKAFRHRTVHDFGGKEKCCYFFWQGDDCSVTEKGASALLTVELDEEKGPQIRVPQGKEPPAFLQLFSGGLTVLDGKRPVINDVKEPRIEKKVFCVRGEVPHEAYLIEIPKADSWALRSRGCLVAVSTNLVMLWKGSKATKEANQVATTAAERLQNRLSSFSFKLETFSEGDERIRFWRALGSGREYLSLKDEPAKYHFTPRLFELSRAPGPFSYDEILSSSRLSSNDVCSFPFLQSDVYLSQRQPGLFLVDAHYEVYLWMGWWKPEGDESNALPGNSQSRWLQDKELAMKTAISYGAAKGNQCPVYVVTAGYEPPEFKALFPYWVDVPEARELSAHGYRGPSTRLPVEEELEKLNRKYSLNELQRRPPPEGVDPLRLETYLSAEEFHDVFGMSIEKFNNLAQWKQVNAKKAAGLF